MYLIERTAPENVQEFAELILEYTHKGVTLRDHFKKLRAIDHDLLLRATNLFIKNLPENPAIFREKSTAFAFEKIPFTQPVQYKNTLNETFITAVQKETQKGFADRNPNATMATFATAVGLGLGGLVTGIAYYAFIAGVTFSSATSTVLATLATAPFLAAFGPVGGVIFLSLVATAVLVGLVVLGRKAINHFTEQKIDNGYERETRRQLTEAERTNEQLKQEQADLDESLALLPAPTIPMPVSETIDRNRGNLLSQKSHPMTITETTDGQSLFTHAFASVMRGVAMEEETSKLDLSGNKRPPARLEYSADRIMHTFVSKTQEASAVVSPQGSAASSPVSSSLGSSFEEPRTARGNASLRPAPSLTNSNHGVFKKPITRDDTQQAARRNKVKDA
jgi:hypothetical protein